MTTGLRHATLGVAMAVFVSALASAPTGAQDSRRSVDLAVSGVGISIGDSREITGLRLNVRDTRLARVDGINVTVWKPAKSSGGTVRGMAVGLPYSGADRIAGIGVAVVGLEARQSLRGISVAGIGSGSGGDMSGIHVAGIGIGAGGNVRGIAVGGIGIGGGSSLHGVMIGGIGAGAGGDVRGLVFGGIGAAAGGRLEGIAIGGIGVGSGRGGRGLLVGGIGAGVGGDFEGIALGGVGVGAGGTLRGLAIGGVGVGASALHGIGIGGVGVGGMELRGAFAAVGTIKVSDDGVISGLGISAFNDARTGRQRGLMIGLLNIADQLHGLQVGVLNIARNNPSGRRVLPIVNWNFSGR